MTYSRNSLKAEEYLKRKAVTVEAALRLHAPREKTLIARAMRYSLFAGGKHLRGALVLEGAALCGGKENEVLPAACAVECLHTYSLIHDDLPSMDDDDLRRGKPTNHKVFGEAAAILAGDALLTESFRLLTLCARGNRVKPSAVLEAVQILGEAAGYRGMIGGQAKDTVETDAWDTKNTATAGKSLEYIHLRKTAALIQASLLIGAALAGGSGKEKRALDIYGKNIGLAFQVADDILDIVGNKELLGKRGSDRENNKLTYPALYGVEKSREMARRYVRDAKNALNVFGTKAAALEMLADYIVDRAY